MASDELVTNVLVSNLHCSSCVSTIEDTLDTLSPHPTLIHVSIVSQSVTVHHHRDLAPTVIKHAIEDAGFDIVATPAATEVTEGPSLSRSVSNLSGLFSRRRKHVEQC
ncbi:hypothetical protein NEOLEDRAFT_1067396, partial [Neolentinus lepideus HHB14362 ss-1]